MKLHVFPPSPNARKALFVNAHTGLNLPVEVVDLFAGQQRSEAFLALNPNGRVPVLEFDDGTALWESNAIVNKLAEIAGSDLWPAGDLRHDILRWQFWEGCHWNPACARFIARYIFGDDTVDLDAAETGFRGLAQVLEAHLAGRDWVVGDAMSVADISLGMVLYLRETCHFPMAGFPNLRTYAERIEAQPAYGALRAFDRAA